MISSLLGSADGGSFIGRTTGVVYDLARHLVHGTPRVQRQVLAVLTKLLPQLDMGYGDGLAETPDTPLPLVPTLLYALAGSLTLQVALHSVRCRTRVALQIMARVLGQVRKVACTSDRQSHRNHCHLLLRGVCTLDACCVAVPMPTVCTYSIIPCDCACPAVA